MKELDLREFWAALDALPRSHNATFLYDASHEDGRLRRANLERYLLLMASHHPRLMLVGEAPGYRGTAITGVPFMSLRELRSTPGLLTRSPLGDMFHEPPTAASSWEATSGAMWKELVRMPQPPLLWAAYPSHPHPQDTTLGNRRPSADEVRAGIEIARHLASAFKIDTIVAVGGVAQAALKPFYGDLPRVRHPARGGAARFAIELRAFLDERRS